ncbi:GPI transamidase component PIG-T [Mucidula mucida]|nr:GPI transamidase component PIG-T [Mucidula mucida]
MSSKMQAARNPALDWWQLVTWWFSENVSLRTLPDGRVATTFTFTTLLNDVSPRDPRTTTLYSLPLSLGQILREYAVTELHLTLNAGKWNYQSWGYPEEPDIGAGAALWAWMADGAPTTIDYRWQGLRNALAGLFCASIGSLDAQRTTSPILPFAPEGSLPDWGVNHELRHASLASEHICTENLTPFLKLLPCKSLSGIASLLNPHRLFDANWHGMSVHVLWNPQKGIVLRMTFQSVSDPLRISNTRKQGFCPVVHSSIVNVTLPSSGMYTIKPEPPVIQVSEPLDVKIKWQNNFEYPLEQPTHPMPFSVRRTLQGSSQDRGQLSVFLTNHMPVSMQVIYLETMPWIVHTYTLLSNTSYIPPVPHAKPATFQTLITLPKDSVVQLTIDVTKAFLRYTEHPPDAQRGWDLPPAVLIPVTEGHLYGARIYTPPLLVDLATPDFSMPYNVIIFSCSLIAFIFGTIFNLLTRKFVVVPFDPDGTAKVKSD